MNPVFVFLVILGAAVFWFLLSWVFPKIGGLLLDMIHGFNESINEREDDEDER